MVLSEVGDISILGARVTWNLWWRTEASPGVFSQSVVLCSTPKAISHCSLQLRYRCERRVCSRACGGGSSAAWGVRRLQTVCENRGWIEVSRVGTAGSSPGGQRGGAERAAAEGEMEAGQGDEMGGSGVVAKSSALPSKDTEVETSDQ